MLILVANNCGTHIFKKICVLYFCIFFLFKKVYFKWKTNKINSKDIFPKTICSYLPRVHILVKDTERPIIHYWGSTLKSMFKPHSCKSYKANVLFLCLCHACKYRKEGISTLYSVFGRYDTYSYFFF